MTIPTSNQPPLNLEDFSKKSLEYYNEIKSKLEAEAMNKYVALDYETKKYWVGETVSDVLTQAKAEFPNKVFYLLQVGSPTTFSIQSIGSEKVMSQRSSYGYNWAH